MINKFVRIAVLIIPIALLILLFSQKSNLQKYISKEIKSQVGSETALKMDQQIDSLYNYSINNKNYKLTFLEIGAKGCSACRKMELVLDDLREEYPMSVKIVFINILIAENQEIMKYYGVVSIPTQILLDNTGSEFFRHTGYISTKDISKVIDSKMVK